MYREIFEEFASKYIWINCNTIQSRDYIEIYVEDQLVGCGTYKEGFDLAYKEALDKLFSVGSLSLSKKGKVNAEL